MMILKVFDAPQLALAQSLTTFEQQFIYPLGSDETFRIVHGEDYSRFLRSMGDACVFVVESNGTVLGTLGVTIRNLRFPNGEVQKVAYCCDLKLSPEARKGRVLWRLLGSARSWINDQCDKVFCVVMDGTQATPNFYSGRVGLEKLGAIANVGIFRIPCGEGRPNLKASVRVVSQCEGVHCFEELCRGRFAILQSNCVARSVMTSVWLALSDHSACGFLEDTRCAKCLFRADGEELVSVHLSCFAFRTLESGVSLIRQAVVLCAEQGIPALFISLAPDNVKSFLSVLKMPNVLEASATVYGYGFPSGFPWNINTAEV
jgi:hypothetical protein